MKQIFPTFRLSYKMIPLLKEVYGMIYSTEHRERATGLLKNMTMLIRLYSVVSIISFCLCSTTTTTGPGGTDFPNTRTAVVGQIANADGTAGSSTVVQLVPADYNPLVDTQEVVTDTTDSDGNFTISPEENGIYNLHAIHRENGTRLMVTTIEVNDSIDTAEVGERTLGYPGAVLVALPDNVSNSGGSVYLVGTTYSASVVDGQSYVVIDSVPSGTVPSIYYVNNESENPTSLLLQETAEVVSGDTTPVAPENGNKFIRFFLNTTDSGAKVKENVYDFPVAVRLENLPVAMSEMAEDGSDIVITDSRMKQLPVQIETWDIGVNSALLWVLVDTVYGDNATQFLYLFWGKDANETMDNNGTVFTAKQGFAAVWHLNAGCGDATGNGNDGEKYGQVTDTNGILGGAQQFYGEDSIVIPGLLGEPSTVTLSAWAKLDTAVEKGAEVVSIGDAALIRMDDYWGEKGCQGSYYSYPDSVDTMTHAFLGSGRKLAETGWHFFTYVFNNEDMLHRFFIDGELCCEEQVTVPIHYDSIGTNVVIGNHGNGKKFWPFKGSIDEVRVSDTVRNEYWIRLCFMNQKDEDKLIYVK